MLSESSYSSVNAEPADAPPKSTTIVCEVAGSASASVDAACANWISNDSTMVTLATDGEPAVTPAGSCPATIDTPNCSSPSVTLSAVVGMLTVPSVSPAAMTAVKLPDWKSTLEPVAELPVANTATLVSTVLALFITTVSSAAEPSTTS